MMWTTPQKDGTFRTIDTENCSMFDLIAETILMRREAKEAKKKVKK